MPSRAPRSRPGKVARKSAEVRTGGLSALTLSLVCAIVIALGWRNRGLGFVRPDSGVGYALGILGVTCMLLLCLYSVRKRVAALGFLGPLRVWFRLHMFLGIIGPLAILYHCDFHRGSVNSTVALFSMLIVFISGLIGRFIYTKIHKGVYGRRVTLDETRERFLQVREEVKTYGCEFADVDSRLHRFEQRATDSSRGLLGSLFLWPCIVLWARFLSLQCRRRVSKMARHAQQPRTKGGLERASSSASESIREYLHAVVKLVELRLYERLFSLWHAFHIPFIFLMFLAAMVHVVAVQMY